MLLDFNCLVFCIPIVHKTGFNPFCLYSVARVGELLVFHTEIQKSFCDRLKEFRNQFEMILEGERVVAAAKSQLEINHEKEARARKDMKRVSKRRDTNSEVRDLTQKLEQAEKEKDVVRIKLRRIT